MAARNPVPRNAAVPDIKVESIREKLLYIMEYALDHNIQLAALCVNRHQYMEMLRDMQVYIPHTDTYTKQEVTYCGVPLRIHDSSIPVGIVEVQPQSDFSYPYTDITTELTLSYTRKREQ